MHYLEFRDEKSQKFWEVKVVGSELTVRYGKIGATGQSKTKSFASNADAVLEADKQAAKKRKKGYIDAKLGGTKKGSAKSNPKKKQKVKATKTTPKKSSKPLSKKAVEELVIALQHSSRKAREKTAEEVRVVCKSNENLDLMYALFRYLTIEFEAFREPSITAEHKNLRKRLSRSTQKKHLAMVEYVHALELFSKHGVGREKKVRKHLEKAAAYFPWYEQTIGHFETGVACEEALKEKNFARLFYLQIHEARRISYDKPVSPWLIRAITNPDFSKWVLRRKSAPKAPKDLKLPDSFDPSWFFNSFFYDGNNKTEYWDAGRRELAASLLLLSEKKTPKIGKAFQSMAEFGDLNGLRFLYPLGTSKVDFSKGLQATRRVEILDQFLEWGVSPAQAKTAMGVLVGRSCDREIYEKLLSAGVKPNEICTSDRMRNGKLVKLKDRILHKAASRSNAIAVEVLLEAGADPTIENSEGKTPGDCAKSAEILELLAASSTSFSVADALAYISKAKTGIKEAEKKRVVKTLKKLGQKSPLSFALGDPGDEMGSLAKALLGLDTGQIQKEKELRLSDQMVVESSLKVSGRLSISNHVLVLGDVNAKEISIGEGGSLALTGNLTASSLYCGGHLHAPSKLESKLVTGFDGAHIRAENYVVGLSVLYAYCGLDAKKVSGPCYNFDHGVEADDPEYQELVARLPKSCVSKNEVEFGVLGIDFRKLIKLALSGKLKIKS